MPVKMQKVWKRSMAEFTAKSGAAHTQAHAFCAKKQRGPSAATQSELTPADALCQVNAVASALVYWGTPATSTWSRKKPETGTALYVWRFGALP